MNSFKEYLEKIKKETESIPDDKILFWGLWFCNGLYSFRKKEIQEYFKSEENIEIDSIMSFINSTLNSSDYNQKTFDDYYEIIQNLDETYLDQTETLDRVIYELIMAIDFIFNYLNDENKGWTYNISQSFINVIDTILDDEGLDILSNDGFGHDIVQKEINAQIKMINKLKSDEKALIENLNDFR